MSSSDKKSDLGVDSPDESLVSAVAPVRDVPKRDVKNIKQAPTPAQKVEVQSSPLPVPTYRAPKPVVVDAGREGVQVSTGVFRLHRFIENVDYVDVLNNRMIISIGRNVHDGRIEAAVDARYYGDPNWECLFLR